MTNNIVEAAVRACQVARVCRVCGKPISLPEDEDYPERYNKCAGKTIGQVTLNYGEEFAHTECLINKTETEINKNDF